jgi:hypothetical protein
LCCSSSLSLLLPGLLAEICVMYRKDTSLDSRLFFDVDQHSLLSETTKHIKKTSTLSLFFSSSNTRVHYTETNNSTVQNKILSLLLV